MRYAAITLSVLASAATYVARAQTGNEAINGNWSLRLGEMAGKVNLLLERSTGKHHMSHARDDVPMSQLAGLTIEQIKAPAGAVVRFQISREAGVLECE